MTNMDLEEFFRERKALNEALKYFQNHRILIFIAPTGYGKTLFSLKLYKEIVENEKLSYRLIHVVPYKALVHQIFEEKFKPYGQNVTGYQSHEEIDVDYKSPFFLRKLIVTTSDSFFYNLFKIPVGEFRKVLKGISHGHYYIPLASIFTSMIIFDEAHMYLNDAHEENRNILGMTVVASSIRHLHNLDLPIIIETATMNSTSIANLVKKTIRNEATPLIYLCSDEKLCPQLKALKNNQLNVVSIEDRSFEEKHEIEWHTEFVAEEDLVKKIKDICSSEPVLVTRNTINSAIETYTAVQSICNEVVLIHGLLSNKDRRKAIEKANKIIAEKKPGVIVATQVIEAGVEIGYATLFTDNAPVENIAQRAGRLCREKISLDYCKNNGARVYIIISDKNIKPYSHENVQFFIQELKKILDSGNKIDWRLFRNRPGYISFTELLEKTGTIYDEDILSNIFEKYIEKDTASDELEELMHITGTKRLVRAGIPIYIVIPPYEHVETLKDLEIVSIDIERLARSELPKKFEEKCLEYIEENPALLIAYRDKDKKLKFIKTKSRIILKNVEKKSMWEIARSLEPIEDIPYKYIDGVFLLAKDKCYQREKGLRIW